VSLKPVDTSGGGSGLCEGVRALPPSLAKLALLPPNDASLGMLPGLKAAEREGVGAGRAWRLSLEGGWWSVEDVLEMCAAFDGPGLPCRLVERVELSVTPRAGAGPGALDAYLGQCAEVAGRLQAGGTLGLLLSLLVDEGAAGAGVAGGDGYGGDGFLGRVLGAVLPAAALHVAFLQLLLGTGAGYPPGFSAHLVAPAFPLLEQLGIDSSNGSERSMAAADVAALAGLAAPRLSYVCLLTDGRYDYDHPESMGGAIHGGPGAAHAVAALAVGLARRADTGGRPPGPGELEIKVGLRAGDAQGAQEAVEGALAEAGLGWVSVEFLHAPFDEPPGEGDEGSEGSG
jgi:hypothetical protein